MPHLRFTIPLLAAIASASAAAQPATRPPLPPALGVPKPGPVTDAPYAPQPILQGGIVLPLYPPGSPYLKADRVREAEVYNMSQAVPGRISSIVNIHNPSIEFHPVDRSLNTGAVVILVPGGGDAFARYSGADTGGVQRGVQGLADEAGEAARAGAQCGGRVRQSGHDGRHAGAGSRAPARRAAGARALGVGAGSVADALSTARPRERLLVGLARGGRHFRIVRR